MAILLLNGLRAAVVYALYQAAVRRIGALRVSVLVALEVPFTMFWDSAWLGRVPATRLIWGSLTILSAALTLGWDSSARENGLNMQRKRLLPRIEQPPSRRVLVTGASGASELSSP